MKNLFVIFLSFCCLLLCWCSKDNSEITTPQNTTNKIEHSVSGWELYSWKIEDQWKYSILIGTNRLKTYEEVTALVSERLSAGNYTYEWNASNLASGVYLFRLQARDYIETRKMV